MRIFCPAMVADSPSLCSHFRFELAYRGCDPERFCISRSAAARSPRPPPLSFADVDDASRAYRPATLANGEPQALLHGYRLDQLDLHVGGVARPDHLGALG